MSLENRPFVGTWGMRNRTLVRYTPDMLVYINGYLHIPGCRACNGSIDFQKYITSVTIDPSVNAVANATVSLSIPQHAAEAFTGDGNYLLRTGLFVTIYMRGYFPMKGVAGRGEDGASTVANFDPTKVPVYPYYQVFRGVVTQVSHEYNAGVYSVSMSCSDYLHFWSNLKVATNGALFGPRPDNSNVQVYLRGHRFTGSTPYEIIYSLFRIGFGSSGGVEFTMGRKTNIASVSDSTGESLSKMAGLHQERLFNSRNVNLRMYGIDGSLYNGFSQSYLGAFQGQGQADAEENARATASAAHDRNILTMTSDHKRNARLLGFNPLSTIAAVASEGKDPARINVLSMAAFQKDMTQQGQVNQFETDYMTKLEIANAVCEVTGFEFYQDVDGDIVFKPPFYNMDTKDDPVFVIKDRDLISLSEQDAEPEATYIKGTGSHFQNTSGTGLEGWLGVAAMYADYRLIADFGWREATFETAYLSDPRAIYISAINRLDVVNAGRRSANITIPLRPELKPGYPVYLEGTGCYYYVESLNHSFQFGSQCTTQITGTAKRGKFHAPGNSGGPITVNNITLGNPYLPACPISTEGGANGPPRYIGFPNVVLALDPDFLNAHTMMSIKNALTVEQVFQIALAYGVLEFSGESGVPSAQYDGEFVMRRGNTTTGHPFTKASLEGEFSGVQAALRDSSVALPSGQLSEIVSAVQRLQPDSDQRDLINYLTLLNDSKARLAPGMSLTGQYRYYSSSHPLKQHQGQKPITLDSGNKAVDAVDPNALLSPTNPEPVSMFQQGTSTLEQRTPEAGIAVTALDSDGKPAQRVLQTNQIQYVTFARTEINTINTMIRIDEGDNYAYNLQINTALEQVMRESLLSAAAQGSPADMASARMEERYNALLEAVKDLGDQLVVEGAFSAVSSESAWQRKYAALDTVQKAFAKDAGTGPRNRRRDPDTNTLMALYNKTDDTSAVSVASTGLSALLQALIRYTFQRAIALAEANREEVAESLTQGVDGRIEYTAADTGLVDESFNPNPFAQLDPLYRARDVFLTAVAQGNIIYGTWNGETTVRTSFPNTTKQIATTPIFPVSDEEGFEVYGSFGYGRGINIASYAALLQSAGADGDVIVGTGNTTSLQTLLATEQFLASLKANPADPTGALTDAVRFADEAYEVASPELIREDITRALAAQGLEISSDNQIVSIDERDPDSKAAAASMTGSPADSSSAEQSTLAANAPVELARIDPGTTEICDCKGSESAFFLQAFSNEYAKLDSNEAVQTFLEDEVRNRGFGWEMGKEAMAGQIRDSTYTSMGERFQKMKGDYAALFSSTENAMVSAGAAFDEINLLDEVEQSVQEFEDAGLIVTPMAEGGPPDE